MIDTPYEPLIVQEVGPRDGLQMEKAWIATDDKVSLIEGCAAAGMSRIEASSFVSPVVVPTLRDAQEVFARIARRPGTVYVALVPNVRGARRAIAAGVDEMNMVVSASETHHLANMRMGREESLEALAQIEEIRRTSSTLLNGTVATAFGCPFEGAQVPDKVLGLVSRYLDIGVDGVTLADTTGMANPRQVRELVQLALERVPSTALTLHFHNTRGMGLVNALAAYEAGARRFDASLGGLGGCPFAPGATGNVCSEDLVNMCCDMGIPTGVDLQSLIALSRRLPLLIGHQTDGQVAKANRANVLHPAPPNLTKTSARRPV
jgi:hydroxymethylglutaryl-CoA lyase